MYHLLAIGSVTEHKFFCEFLIGLKHEIRAIVRVQPTRSITRATVLACIQEDGMEVI
jgi:hypothetical protein